MSKSLKKEILSLSVPDRILLVEDIWDSIVAESKEKASLLTDNQKIEIDRRLKLYRSNQTKTYSWEEIKENLKRP